MLNSGALKESDKIKAISKLSSEIYDNTKDFVWLLNPDNNNIFSLCQYIRDYGEQFFDMFDGIDFYYESDLKENNLVSYDIVKNIVLAFKEISINTVKHANASNVILTVQSQEDHFRLEVHDDGCGFTETNIIRGNGLSNIEKRMAKINADLKVDTERGVRYIIELNQMK